MAPNDTTPTSTDTDASTLFGTSGGEGGESRSRGGVDGDHGVGPERGEASGQTRGTQPRHPEGERRVARHVIAQGVGGPPYQRRPAQQGQVEVPAGPLEERVDELAEVIDDGDGGAASDEAGGQAPRGLVVAGAVARGEDQNASHVRSAWRMK